jgi:hypothetical protein
MRRSPVKVSYMPRALVHRFRYTTLMVVIALLVLASAMLWNIDVFEWPGLHGLGIQENEVGEVVIAFLAVIPAFFIDHFVVREQRRAAELTSNQLFILQGTMRTVQDIVSVNLRQLQLVRIGVEGCVPDETLRIFDTIIRDTTIQLKALGGVVVDSPMASPALPSLT